MGNTIHYFIDTEFPEKVSYLEEIINRQRITLLFEDYGLKIQDHTLKHIFEELALGELDIQLVHDNLNDMPKGILIPEKSAGIIFNRHIEGNIKLENIKSLLKNAKKIHNEIEKIYIANMNFGRLDEMNDVMINQLFKEENYGENSIEINRFFGAMCLNGNKNYIDNLTENLNKRYFIKGRAGTGKSTFMKKIGEAALKKGLNIEKYHCSFDPESVDMIIIRKLGICIFDSTAPHEMFPTKNIDSIIDIYSECVNPGTDEKYEEELSYFKDMYDEMIIEARKNMTDYYEITTNKDKFDNSKDIEAKEIAGAFLKLIKSV